MKHKGHVLFPAYRAALGRHLNHGSIASLQPAKGLGRRAVRLGLATVDLARIHKLALLSVVESLPPARVSALRKRIVRRAGIFFAWAIHPIEATHRTSMDANVRLRELNLALDRRSRDLFKSNRKLRREIARRIAVEETLRTSEARSNDLLKQSRRMQDELRLLSRRVLSAQEDERKRVSRELHDVIAQMLTGINARLASLKMESVVNIRGMSSKISRTQRLVQKSVDIVHRFARELRPAVLDDLGLIPALHSYLKGFTKETGIRVHLTAFAGIEVLGNEKRTALYRVAQEALCNVSVHAQASRVDVAIRSIPGAVRMSIKDDGKSFDVDEVLRSRRSKHLGLLGMRERVEMVGGTLAVESRPGHGTTVHATIPFNGSAREKVRS